MKIDIATPGGLRAGAFLAILGGCIIMTLFAGYGLYVVRASAPLSFWLAVAAHVQILVGMTGLIALFVKRSFKVTRGGVEISDHVEEVK